MLALALALAVSALLAGESDGPGEQPALEALLIV